MFTDATGQVDIGGQTYRLVINRRVYHLVAEATGQPHTEVIRRAIGGSVRALTVLWWAILHTAHPQIDVAAAADLLQAGGDDVLNAVVAMIPTHGLVQ